MTQYQKIIIGVVAFLFVVGIGSAFRFLVHQEGAIESRSEVQLPVSQTETMVSETPKKQEGTLPPPEAMPGAMVTSKAEAEKMLQDTESDFAGIESDLSVQE